MIGFVVVLFSFTSISIKFNNKQGINNQVCIISLTNGFLNKFV